MNVTFPLPDEDYKLYVRCFTYNQSAFIVDALNGFAIQKTDYPFACMIVDDCSTDGEQEVIRTWLESECKMPEAKYYEDSLATVIQVSHKSNSNCTMYVYFLKENLYKQKDKKMAYVKPWREHCKYEALCEGDDYWVDPEKLQMQVDFLDHHDDYVLVYSDFSYIDKENRSIIKNKVNAYEGEVSRFLIIENFITTPTVFFRTKCINGYSQIMQDYGKPLPFGDLSLWLYFSVQGKFKYFKCITANYRVLSESASHFINYEKAKEFADKVLDFKLYFNRKFHILESTEKIESNYFETIIPISAFFHSKQIWNELINCFHACPRLFLSPLLSVRIIKNYMRI